MRRTEVDNVSADDLLARIHNAVREATAPLAHKVAELDVQLRESRRRTITHRAAADYFEGAITPKRVLEYIHGKRLPDGITTPLPANKIGHQYFIDVETLEKWLAGKI